MDYPKSSGDRSRDVELGHNDTSGAYDCGCKYKL